MGNTEKNILIVLNGLFVIISLLITFFGVWILCDDKSLEKLHLDSLSDYNGLYGTLAIIIGITSIIVHFLGILGAYRGSSILLKIYAGILIAGVIMGFLQTMTSLSSLNVKSVTNFEALYRNDSADTLAGMNSLQKMFECCGYKRPEDVHTSGGYPWSCCGIENQICTVPLYKEGCLRKVKRVLTNIVVGSLVVKVIGILIHVVCIFAALRLASKVVEKMAATPVYVKMF